MNFAPFTGHIPTAAAIPTIHQFAAKFGYEGSGNGGSVVQETRYQSTGGSGVQFVPASGTVSVDGVKFRQADSVVVVSSAQPGTVTLAGLAPIHTVNTGVKYQTISASSSSVNLGNIAYGGQSYVQAEAVQHLKAEHRDKREYREELQHDLMATMMQQQVTQATPLQQGTQQLLVVLHEPKEAAALARAIKQEARPDRNTMQNEFISIGDVTDTSTWQTLGGGVADYLSALPIPLHHLLKYSTPVSAIEGKRDEPTIVTVSANSLPNMPIVSFSHHAIGESPKAAPQMPSNSVVVQTATIVNQATSNASTTTSQNNVVVTKKKKKKRYSKEKKPRPKPGEIRLTTALGREMKVASLPDGSTLYCCPECHMAYPEQELLEQHLVGHTMERRFICDICNAALKRKDHLTRHKQSHNPERPHVCTVCLKAFKRKEQLTLHFVIHSGEKRHVCNECGKALKRKDHLARHMRTHRVDRPYVCLLCMRAYKRREALRLHTLTHSLELPNVCKVCNKAFIRKELLTQHMRTHKPYECPVCQDIFALKCQLDVHFTLHGKKLLICDDCGEGFYRKDHLRKHTRSHIARRVKAELSQGVVASSGSPATLADPVPAPTPTPTPEPS